MWYISSLYLKTFILSFQDDVDGPGMAMSSTSSQNAHCSLNAEKGQKKSEFLPSVSSSNSCQEHPGKNGQSKISSLINIHENMIDEQSNNASGNSQRNTPGPKIQHNIMNNSAPSVDESRTTVSLDLTQPVHAQEQITGAADSKSYVNSVVVIRDAIHESIGKFCVSMIGTIVFIHGKQDSFGRTHFSLRKMENGETKTIIPESSEMINDITLIETDGADCPEALVVVYGEMLTVVGLYNERAERRILKLDNANSFICAHGRNSVVVVTRVIGAHENDTHLLIQTLQITGSKTKLRTCVPTKFDVAGLNDICVRRDLLFVCCRKNNYVAAIGITDGDLHWKVEVKSPFGICRVKNHLFVTSYAEHRVVRINAQTGMVNHDLQVESFVQAPTSVYFSDGHLHMAHVDANNLRQKNRRDWCISQYKIV